MLQDQFAAAFSHYERYLDQIPNEIAALLGAANCAYSLGRHEEARGFLDRLFARQKDHPGGLLLQARLEMDAGRPAKAVELLQRAETVAPHETDITYALLQAHQGLGHAQEVKRLEKRLEDLRQRFKRLEELRKQIARQPDSVPLRFEAGNLCLSLGRDEEAGRWFRSLLQLDPQHAPTHRLLADYFHRLGDERQPEGGLAVRDSASPVVLLSKEFGQVVLVFPDPGIELRPALHVAQSLVVTSKLLSSRGGKGQGEFALWLAF